MTRTDEFIGQLESYLDHYEGNTPLPESVRHAIRAELRTIRQIRRVPGLRLATVTVQTPSAARYGLVAAAMAAAVMLGASLFGGGIGTPPDATPTPLPLATPGALPAAASLEPGRYIIANPYLDDDPVFSSDYQSIAFTVPAGWDTADGLIYKHLDEPTEVAFSVWTPGDMYLDPCRWQTSQVDSNPSAHTDTAIGEIVLGGQHPLLNQIGRQATAPTNVTLGGQRALRIELSISADLDIAGCDQGEFRSWTEWGVPGGANSHHAPGQVDVVYFVDVDQRTLFIDASHMPAASEADLAELEAILDSMFIDRGPTRGASEQVESPSPTLPPNLGRALEARTVRNGPLDSGDYTFYAVDGTLTNVMFSVPTGWEWDGRLLNKIGLDDSQSATIAFSKGDVQVYTDPCHWADAEPDPPTGVSVRDLVTALAAQPLRSATTPTDRPAAGLDPPNGWAGMAVELTVPDDIDLADCDLGQFRSWGPEENARSHQGPGQRDLVWVVDGVGNGVDADGHHLIIDVATFPDTPLDVMSEIDAILDSLVVGGWG